MSFCILGIRLKNSRNEIELSEQLKDNNIISLLPNYENIESQDTLQVSNQEEYIINSVDEDNMFDEVSSSSEDGEYEIYSKIETHMSISSSLYILNKQGANIMKNIHRYKLLSSKNNTGVQRVYNEMEYFINHDRACNDLYTDLINVLDAVMFEECGELDSFYVKEDEYTLESLYYKQGSWVSEIEWNNNDNFTFSNTSSFDEGECMYLLMYVIKYLNLLSRIENEYKNIKLKTCIDKMKDKMRNMHYVIENTLEGLLEGDNVVIKKTI
jgi:hypothetical protein